MLLGTTIGVKHSAAGSALPSTIKTLKYDNATFDIKNATSYNLRDYATPLEIANSTATAAVNNTIFAYWSKPLQQNINFIEDKFRVLDATNNTDNHAGITWNDGHKLWYTFLRDKGLSIYNSVDKEFAINTKVIRERGVWNTLAIAFLNKTINVYVNNILRLQIPTITSDNASFVNASTISKVGIRNFNALAEFKPIKIGEVSLDNIQNSTTQNKVLPTNLYYK